MRRPCPSPPSPLSPGEQLVGKQRACPPPSHRPTHLSPGAACPGSGRAARPAAPSRAPSTSGRPCRRRKSRRRGRRGWASRRRPPPSAVSGRWVGVKASRGAECQPRIDRAWLWSKTRMRVSGGHARAAAPGTLRRTRARAETGSTAPRTSPCLSEARARSVRREQEEGTRQVLG